MASLCQGLVRVRNHARRSSVADDGLSGALAQKLAFGCHEVKEGLAFVGLGPGQGEGDGQALGDREGIHVVRHKTILDTLVLVPAGTPWTTPPGGTSVIPATAHPEEKLADAKKLLSLPRIVVICGSTRFMTEMNEADLRETKAGKIVVKPGCDMKSPHELWSDPVEAQALKVRLHHLHRAKIRLADEALVVGDYIGDRHPSRNRLRPVAGQARAVHAPRSRP